MKRYEPTAADKAAVLAAYRRLRANYAPVEAANRALYERSYALAHDSLVTGLVDAFMARRVQAASDYAEMVWQRYTVYPRPNYWRTGKLGGGR